MAPPDNPWSSSVPCRIAATGRAAVDLSRELRPHILLTDLVMPHMSGTELAAQLPDVDVVYMSGYSDEAVFRHGIIRPGTAFIEKPFSHLTIVVREVRESA